MYCMDELCGLSEQTRATVCQMDTNLSSMYNASKSSTFKHVEKEIWKHELVNVRTLIGTYGCDKMTITDVENKSLTFDNFEFVRGRSLDKRLNLTLICFKNCF